MTALTWQALLFLTVAYFAGCCLGCILRRTFRRQPAGAPLRHVQVASTTGAQPIVAEHTHAVGKSSTGSPGAATVSSLLPRGPIHRAEADVPISTAVAEQNVARAPADRGKAVPRFERALSGEGSSVDRQFTPVTTPSVAQLEDKGAPAAEPDDLKRIHLIDAALVSRLNALGVRRFAEIAQWTASDVARISHELGFKGRVQKENWIEQAQILTKGGETYYARRVARGETAGACAIADDGVPRTGIAVRQMPTIAYDHPDVSGRSAFADKTVVGQTAEQVEQADKTDVAVRDAVAPARPLPVGMARDNLQRIRGINAEVEDLVSLQGVARFAQIASWSKLDVERFDRLLGQDGRIARENWIEQAQILAKGGDTTYSREFDRHNAGVGEDQHTMHPSEDAMEVDDARLDKAKPTRTTDISGLRSVRSQALRAPDKALPGTSDVGSSRARRMVVPGDLKRIRGVGLLIERRLRSLGVNSYEDIANWTAADIDRVSRTLDFKGRIERENWVEQARILATGGQTEFSRRFDRSAGKA